MSSNEDDFWNASSSSQQNFFDGDDEITPCEADVFSGVSQEKVILPIHSIISNECLKIVLDDTNFVVDQVVPPPEQTMKRKFCGENIILTAYKTLEDKLLLLDAALDIADGDIILTVILFLKKSLSSNLFFTQLAKRNAAVKHYANYLVEINDLQQLADLYMATRNIPYLKHIYCLLAKDDSNQNSLLKKLQQFNIQHAHNFYSPEDKSEIQENMSFLEFQIKHNLNSKSLIGELTNLYMTKWEKDGSGLIDDFQKQFKMDSFQCDWVIMSVCCKMKNWDKLLTIFINKSLWVIKKRVLRSGIRPDLFVLAISRHKPPENIIEQFLGCVGDASKRLTLAEKLDVHTYVINYYVEQKDKISLLKYMERVEPESQAMYLLRSSLNNPDIKWKN
ncbi:spermatogenesis-defective protein 39 homolog [Tribolium madens]|uniref:spermatogenesis-defective protein 39 homolog n=1 Tax=Tribolium madens TaxID=41895 RepID=UPI001CF72B15|nr:spermatogenesis-defective protein 39 homolog [Tribolium madens]XP_044256719.1 spermatogenesis-defective protein 39 homolog [Tribolium madens]